MNVKIENSYGNYSRQRGSLKRNIITISISQIKAFQFFNALNPVSMYPFGEYRKVGLHGGFEDAFAILRYALSIAAGVVSVIGPGIMCEGMELRGGGCWSLKMTKNSWGICRAVIRRHCTDITPHS